MQSITWYEAVPHRLILETIRVSTLKPSFTLRRRKGILYWVGKSFEIPQGTSASPLHFAVLYPEGFPAVPPSVEIISPELNSAEWGHDWHRWRDGDICYVRPSKWQTSTTADEIILKVKDWYFNYVAKKSGLASTMPDVGRVSLPATTTKDDSGEP
jgi:hypothetical protein